MSLRFFHGGALLVAAALLGCTSGKKTTTCSNGLKDDGSGHCVECVATADCAAGTFCDGSHVCASCSTNPDSCAMAGNGSCKADADCGASGKICSNFVCVDGCANNAACGSGKYCDESHHCQTGCGADSQCSGLSCCSHVCTDTQSNPAMNCGGCGMPACDTGNSCCNGGCTDVQTDAANCGACGNDCGGASCVNGECKQGYGLFGLFSLTGKSAGDAANSVILKPFLYTRDGALDYQALLQRPCFATHWDATHAPSGELNAGDVTVSGYAGGTFLNTMTAPSDIGCQFQNGDYTCGYGAVMNNMVGPVTGQSPFAEGTNALGTGTISFSAPGADTFGSFNLTATPGTGLGVTEDLSTLTYSASADTVIHIACPTSGCGFGGFLVVVQASSNDLAHFDEPATAGGSLVCLGGYGGFGGFSLGDPVATISSADIGTMLGGDATIKTFQTTFIQLGQTDLQNIGQARGSDSQGHQVIALARSGSYGVSTVP